MILFLHGQDTYRLRQRLREVIEEYKKANPNWLDFVKIDVSDKETDIFEKLRQSINAVSMFNEKKLICIENIFSANQETQERILDFFNKNIEKDKDVTIVFWTEEVKPESKLFEFLRKSAKVQEFNLLRSYQLREWIKKYAEKQGRDINNQAIEKLINYIGNDLWRMSNEIEKLASFTKQRIEEKDVEELVNPEIDTNIFNTIDALGQKNKKQALRLVREHLIKGESEGYLLNRFVYQFRNLLRVKDLLERGTSINLLAKKAGLHPFVAQKTSQQVRNFSFEELKKIYQKLFEIDFNIKTGKIDARTALELFIVGL